jgi:hypothetical protein
MNNLSENDGVMDGRDLHVHGDGHVGGGRRADGSGEVSAAEVFDRWAEL